MPHCNPRQLSAERDEYENLNSTHSATDTHIHSDTRAVRLSLSLSFNVNYLKYIKYPCLTHDKL